MKLLAGLLWIPALALSAPPRVAHEYVPFRPGERSAQPAAAPPAPAPLGRMPEAISYRGLMLPAPTASPAPARDEAVLGPQPPPSAEPGPSPLSPEPPASEEPPPAPASRPKPAPASAPATPPQPTRSDAYEPDHLTGGDPTLHYAATFQPSVAPFKRFDAKDRVDASFRLRNSDPRLRRVRVGGGPRGDRDLFFASVALRGPPGAPIPIPSVAPDARILRYEAIPASRVRFFRDGVDNYYVKVSRRGLIRLNFLTDAAESYFGGAVPRLPLAKLPRTWRPRLPPPVRARADVVLRALGIDRRGSLRAALSTLVAHFRAYRAGPTPALRSRADLFERLATGGVGACRHRAYAFVILVQALGLPARFLTNEAHAFTEVWLPRNGWRRIDLGGLSDELVVHGGADKVAHRPRRPDPLPQPSSFSRGYTRRMTDPPAEPPPPPPSLPPAPRTPPPEPPAPPAPPPSTPPTTPAPASPLGSRRAPTRVLLTSVQRDALRGETLDVTGTVETESGQPAPGLRIEVYLADQGSDQRRRIGVLLTDTSGTFAAQLPLPRDLRAGRYRLFVQAIGDRRYRPSASEQ